MIIVSLIVDNIHLYVTSLTVSMFFLGQLLLI